MGKEFILAYVSRRIRIHPVRKVWQQAVGMRRMLRGHVFYNTHEIGRTN